MPRIRTVKPYIWSDEAIGRVSRDARLLFVGMVTQADDDGRLVATASALIGAIYPYDDLSSKQVERWRDELQQAGLVVLYQVGRAVYASLVGFSKHQRIQKRQPSSLPAPPPDDDPGSATSRVPVAYSSATSHALPPLLVRDESPLEVEVEVEVEVEKSSRSPVAEATFEEWWGVYPRKVGKRTARTAWERACRRMAPDVILTATQGFRDDPNRDPAFTPHPATWLNRDGWQDEPCQPRNARPNKAEERDRRHLALIEHFSPNKQGEIA